MTQHIKVVGSHSADLPNGGGGGGSGREFGIAGRFTLCIFEFYEGVIIWEGSSSFPHCNTIATVSPQTLDAGYHLPPKSYDSQVPPNLCRRVVCVGGEGGG